MFDRLELFRLSAAMASHAGTRQAVVSQNIANADTPGYKARDVTPFAEVVGAAAGGFMPRASRAGHLHGSLTAGGGAVIAAEENLSNPNGNMVALEDEMLKAVEVKRQHDRALAIYRSGLTILRTSLGRGV